MQQTEVQEHTCYVISNADTDIFNNTLTDFTNTIPQGFLSKKSDWQLAVENVTFHSNYENIPPPTDYKLGSIIIYEPKPDVDTTMNIDDLEIDDDDFKDALDITQNNALGTTLSDEFREIGVSPDNSAMDISNVDSTPEQDIILSGNLPTIDNSDLSMMDTNLKEPQTQERTTRRKRSHRDIQATMTYTENFLLEHTLKIDFFKLAAKNYDFNSFQHELNTITSKTKLYYECIVRATEHYFIIENKSINRNIVALIDAPLAMHLGHHFVAHATKIVVINDVQFFEYNLSLIEGRYVRVKLPENFYSLKIPKYINIESESIYPTSLGERNGTTALQMAYKRNIAIKSISYSPKKLEYYPLISQDLRSINIKLTDEKYNSINLLPGVASIVKLRLINMERGEFFIRIDSNKKESNSIFNVHLGKRLQFPNRNWKVAMHSIIVPNKYETFPGPPEQRTLSVTSLVRARDLVLPQIIKSKKKLLEILNDFSNIYSLTFELNEKNKIIIKNTAQAPVTLSVSQNLLTVFGNTDFDEIGHKSIQILAQQSYQFTNPINLSALLPNYIFVYCNIIQPTLTGGKFAKILKMITIPNSENDYETLSFENLEFIPIEFQDISEIKFELRTHSGEKVYFSHPTDPVSINLMFTNK